MAKSEMMNRLTDLIANIKTEYDKYCKECRKDGRTPSVFEQHLANELINNGVTLPPCKVGDKIYFVGVYTGVIYEYTVTHITYSPNDTILFTDAGVFVSVNQMLGKTVFLTREEAEAKLKEGNKNGSI